MTGTIASSARRRAKVGAVAALASLPLFPLAAWVAWPFEHLRLSLMLFVVPVTLAYGGVLYLRQARAATRPGLRLPAELCWLEKREGWLFKHATTEYWLTLGDPPAWALQLDEADAERLPDDPTVVMHGELKKGAAAAISVGDELIWPASTVRSWIRD